MANELKLKKLKEGVDRYEVTEVLVAPGQTVTEGQTLLVVNADKSSMDITAPMAGKIGQVKVKVGDEIAVGDLYLTIEGGNGATTEAPSANEPKSAPAPTATAPVVPRPKPVAAVKDGRVSSGDIVPAGPGTRWLARKLGVDIRSLSGSGPNGRITEEDVKSAFGGGGSAPVSMGGGIAIPPLPRFESFGDVTREPLSRSRRLTAQQMALAWSQIPHVTQHDSADITDLEAFRKAQEAKGLKLTVTAFAIKACAIALKQFPTFNASLDLANNQLVLKKYYNIGIAVDTKSGLVVPVLRDVDKKSVAQLAQELTDAAEKARQGKVDMSGGTFTITNLGGIGGTGFTPIVNWPEVAILGMSRGKLTPVIRDGEIVPRLLLPLSLSYDHRVIDGADAARFTRRVAEMLESPWTMVLHG
jgi:pyruvate dehydrogenase E2 component (dihydrolipoamide acetyltransferase)